MTKKSYLTTRTKGANFWLFVDRLFLLGFIIAASVQYYQHKYFQAIYFAIFVVVMQLWIMEAKADGMYVAETNDANEL